MPFLFVIIVAVVIIFIVKAQEPAPKRTYYQRRAPRISPEAKGIRGEAIVSALLKATPKPRYLIDDICIERKGEGSSQIDHVLINARGIWVVETKNYAGKIYGRPESNEWSCFSRRGTKNTFLNPLKQNETHVNVLQSYLGKEAPLRSLVVFVEADISAIADPFVINAEDIDVTVTLGDVHLSPEQIQEYALKLEEVVEMHSISYAEHLENVERLQDELYNNVCPRCHKPLVRRTGKNGATFWGCPSYPDCDFTKNDF